MQAKKCEEKNGKSKKIVNFVPEEDIPESIKIDEWTERTNKKQKT